MTHTPGPWRLDNGAKYVSGGFRVLARSTRPKPNHAATGEIQIAFPPPHGIDGEKEQEANARLIAAAPDLLEALEMVRDADNDRAADKMETIPDIARAKIDRAIAKAKGGAA
jgi:hypothetical protein